MAWAPQLNVVCGRCGQQRGLTHTCFSNSSRPAVAKPEVSFGKCGACGKPHGGNQMAHVCAPKSDFRQRRSRSAKAERAAARRKRQSENHDYQACDARDCPRPLCVAFKAGREAGYAESIDESYGAGFASGYAEGRRA